MSSRITKAAPKPAESTKETKISSKIKKVVRKANFKGMPNYS